MVNVNGKHVFDVTLIDFYYIGNVSNGNERLLSRKIISDELRDWIIAGKGKNFAVRYCGILIDMSN